ncbi:MAG: hypothetical protein R2719_00280 [Micropruina sp.]
MVFLPDELSLRWFAAALVHKPFIDGLVTSLIVALCPPRSASRSASRRRWRWPGQVRRAAIQNLFFSPLIIRTGARRLCSYQHLRSRSGCRTTCRC